ncbi:MAG: hypothetical protein II673_02350 [Ruminococcus sp.]|nr:hypothetical protein [Ruminococcus sp.]
MRSSSVEAGAKGHFIDVGLGMFCAILLGIRQAATVDIGEEPSFVSGQDGGNIGAVDAAALRQARQGQVAVQESLLLFHLLTDTLKQFFFPFPRQRHFFLGRQYLRFQLSHFHGPVGRKDANEENDTKDRKDYQAERKSPRSTVDGCTPAHNQVQDGNDEDALGILLGEVVGVGIVLVRETLNGPQNQP